MPILTPVAPRSFSATLFLSASSSGHRRPLAPARSGSNLGRALTGFPGEDAPGTGKRQFPAPQQGEDDAARKGEEKVFEMKTTAECYEQFPAVVRADNVKAAWHILEEVVKRDTTPGGMALLQEPNIGPVGKRRQPSPYETPVGKNYPRGWAAR